VYGVAKKENIVMVVVMNTQGNTKHYKAINFERKNARRTQQSSASYRGVEAPELCSASF
jgi:hypothetical protein